MCFFFLSFSYLFFLSLFFSFLLFLLHTGSKTTFPKNYFLNGWLQSLCRQAGQRGALRRSPAPLASGGRRCLGRAWRQSLVKRGGLWGSCPLAPTPPQLRPPWRCLPRAGAGGDLGRSGSGSLQRLRVRWRVQQLGRVWGLRPFPACSAPGGEERATACPYAFPSVAFFLLPCLINLICTCRVFQRLVVTYFLF